MNEGIKGKDQQSTPPPPTPVPTSSLSHLHRFFEPRLTRVVSAPTLTESRAAYLQLRLQESQNQDSLKRVRHLSTVSPEATPYSQSNSPERIQYLPPRPFHEWDLFPSREIRNTSPSSTTRQPEGSRAIYMRRNSSQSHWLEEIKARALERRDDDENDSDFEVEIPITAVYPQSDPSRPAIPRPTPINIGEKDKRDGEGEEIRGRSVIRSGASKDRSPHEDRSSSSRSTKQGGRRSSRNKQKHRSPSRPFQPLSTAKESNELPKPRQSFLPPGFDPTKRRQSTPNILQTGNYFHSSQAVTPRRTSLAQPPPPLPINTFRDTSISSSKHSAPLPVVLGFDYPGKIPTPSPILGPLDTIRVPTPPSAIDIPISPPHFTTIPLPDVVEPVNKEEREKKLSEFFLNESRFHRGPSRYQGKQEEMDYWRKIHEEKGEGPSKLGDRSER